MRVSRQQRKALEQLEEAPPEVYQQVDRLIAEHHGKSVRIGLRLSEDEAHAFKVAAEAEGETVSNWIRQRCRAAAGLKSSKKR